ncbi:unnamed protein product, partial [Ectocarpus fasciculatus]
TSPLQVDYRAISSSPSPCVWLFVVFGYQYSKSDINHLRILPPVEESFARARTLCYEPHTTRVRSISR